MLLVPARRASSRRGERLERGFVQTIRPATARLDNRKVRVHVELTADHGLSRSLYVHDPEGNRLKIYYDTMPPVEAMEFMRRGRAGMAPYDVEAITVR